MGQRNKTALLIDALRGGETAWLDDRDTAERLRRQMPGARKAVTHSDLFASAAAEYAVAAGIPNVVFGGIGYPVGEAPHRAAAAVSHTARFFYPSGNPVMVDLRTRSLEGDGRALAYRSTVTDPGGLLGAGALRGLLRGRMQVQWGYAAWLTAGDEAAGLASRWAVVLRPGDQLVMTAAEHACALGEAAGVEWHGHTLEAVTGWAESARTPKGARLLRVAETVHDVRGWPRRWPGLVPRPGGRVVAVIADVVGT